MSFKSDVKAVQATGTGTVFAGATRLRGIIMNSNTSSANGSISLTEVNDSTVLFTTTVRADDDFAFNIPEDGVVFRNGLNVTAITNCTATLMIDK